MESESVLTSETKGAPAAKRGKGLCRGGCGETLIPYSRAALLEKIAKAHGLLRSIDTASICSLPGLTVEQAQSSRTAEHAAKQALWEALATLSTPHNHVTLKMCFSCANKQEKKV